MRVQYSHNFNIFATIICEGLNCTGYLLEVNNLIY